MQVISAERCLVKQKREFWGGIEGFDVQEGAKKLQQPSSDFLLLSVPLLPQREFWCGDSTCEFAKKANFCFCPSITYFIVTRHALLS